MAACFEREAAAHGAGAVHGVVATYNAARWRNRANDFGAAEALLDAVAAAKPGNGDVHVQYGIARKGLGDADGAAAASVETNH